MFCANHDFVEEDTDTGIALLYSNILNTVSYKNNSKKAKVISKFDLRIDLSPFSSFQLKWENKHTS